MYRSCRESPRFNPMMANLTSDRILTTSSFFVLAPSLNTLLFLSCHNSYTMAPMSLQHILSHGLLFLFQLLECMQFPQWFVQWIKECVGTTSYSVVINGEPKGRFRGTKGLRQGDPLSPYLFVLVMEVLNGIFKKEVVTQPGFKYHWRCKKTELVMLSFADDLLVFSAPQASSIQLIKGALEKFGDLAGLEANEEKSNVYFCGVSEGVREELRTITGFQLGTLPVKYLGIPLCLKINVQ